MNEYLTTEEAASYLKLKERKLYELATTGAVPCSKVTGKWLFPRAALDRWIEAGLAAPAGYQAPQPPPIIGGSHDPLLEWAVRRSGSGLAMLSEGSEAGLMRLARNEVAMAAIHLHDDSPTDTANAAAVAASHALFDAVLIAFARREQGLLLAEGNPLGIGSLAAAAKGRARFGLRQRGAGAQLLLHQLLARGGLAEESLTVAGGEYSTGQDLALAIRNGDIDCGIATRSVADIHGLGFLPLAQERFDLALRRRTYFLPSVQALMATLRDPSFARQAKAFGGYDVSMAGCICLNR